MRTKHLHGLWCAAGFGSNSNWYNVQQHRATNLHFTQHTVAPLAARIEAEVAFKLVGQFEQGVVVPRIDMRELYRGDVKTRSEYYRQMLEGGSLSINEVRRAEDLRP